MNTQSDRISKLLCKLCFICLTFMPSECNIPTSPCSTLNRISFRFSTSCLDMPTATPKSSMFGDSRNKYYWRELRIDEYLPDNAIATVSIPPISFIPFLACRPKNLSRWLALKFKSHSNSNEVLKVL